MNRLLAAAAFLALAAGTEKEAPALRPHPGALPNTHPPGDVDNPELVPFVVADPASLPGIVIDETAAVLAGEWQYSTHTPPWVGLGYLHDRKEGKGEKSVTFTPDLPRAGRYEVRLSHCCNVRRAVNTPVTIRHAGGETTLRINQQETPPHGKLFRSLGVFRFEAGTSGWVRISNEDTGDKVVIADAVQFLPQSGQENDARRGAPPSVSLKSRTPALAPETNGAMGMNYVSCEPNRSRAVTRRLQGSVHREATLTPSLESTKALP